MHKNRRQTCQTSWHTLINVVWENKALRKKGGWWDTWALDPVTNILNPVQIPERADWTCRPTDPSSD